MQTRHSSKEFYCKNKVPLTTKKKHACNFVFVKQFLPLKYVVTKKKILFSKSKQLKFHKGFRDLFVQSPIMCLKKIGFPRTQWMRVEIEPQTFASPGKLFQQTQVIYHTELFSFSLRLSCSLRLFLLLLLRHSDLYFLIFLLHHRKTPSTRFKGSSLFWRVAAG